jgi:hypothetical protein
MKRRTRHNARPYRGTLAQTSFHSKGLSLAQPVTHRHLLTIIPDNTGFLFLCIHRVAHNLHHNIRVNNFALDVLICFRNVLPADDNQFQLCRGPADKRAASEQVDKAVAEWVCSSN